MGNADAIGFAYLITIAIVFIGFIAWAWLWPRK
jgi:cbb3-type cytochrome oxidase subunit 3